MTERLIQSVPTDEVERYFHCGWIYLMPDFDKPNHSKVEWVSEKIPVYPLRSKKPTTENPNERTQHRAQQRS